MFTNALMNGLGRAISKNNEQQRARQCAENDFQRIKSEIEPVNSLQSEVTLTTEANDHELHLTIWHGNHRQGKNSLLGKISFDVSSGNWIATAGDVPKNFEDAGEAIQWLGDTIGYNLGRMRTVEQQ